MISLQYIMQTLPQTLPLLGKSIGLSNQSNENAQQSQTDCQYLPLSNTPNILSTPGFQIIRGQYRLEEVIYNENSNQVLFIKNREDSKTAIAKISPIFQINSSKGIHQKDQKLFMEILSSCHHKHIIHIQKAIQGQEKLAYIMQYGCGGDLAKYLSSPTFFSGNFQLSTIKNILWQVLLGLEELHNLGYVYRDLKPSNILFSHDGYLKLCDFGLVSLKGKIDTAICGTPEYMPPQRISEKRNQLSVNQNIDMWSYGVLVYELLMKNTPFRFDGNLDCLLNEIYGGYVYFGEQFSLQARHLISNLLQINPSRRFTIQKVKNHKFFGSGFEYKPIQNLECFCERSSRQKNINH